MLVVGDKNQPGVMPAGDTAHQVEDAPPVVRVQTSARFVQDQQGRRFHHGPGDQDHLALALGELVEQRGRQGLDSQGRHPRARGTHLTGMAVPIQPDRIEKTRTDHIQSRQLLLIGRGRVRAHHPQLLPDFPERLVSAAPAAKQSDPVGVDLQAIAADQF